MEVGPFPPFLESKPGHSLCVTLHCLFVREESSLRLVQDIFLDLLRHRKLGACESPLYQDRGTADIWLLSTYLHCVNTWAIQAYPEPKSLMTLS